MILYLVRHGESLYNAERRIQGQSDVALSPLGLQQAGAIAAVLAKQPIDAIYASPLRRALETAQPLATALNLPIQLDDRLKEINAGIFQGLLWDEIEKQHPAEAVHWRAQEPDFVIPGGESRRALMQRGLACLSEIRERGQQHVVVVAHGGILSAATKAILNIAAELNPFVFYNASISRIAWHKQVKVLTINQLEHLHAADIATETSTGDL